MNILLLVEDGLKGTENQCLGVLEQLGLPFDHHNFKMRAPWRWLSPFLGWGSLCALTPHIPGNKHYDLIIAAGRKAIAPAIALKKKMKAKAVFIQKPINASFARKFDLVIAPAHDRLNTENTTQVIGSPNRISPAFINGCANDFPELAAMAEPRLAVLLGGRSKTHNFRSDDTQNLIKILRSWNGSIIITPSRRTEDTVISSIKDALVGEKQFYIWDGQSPNPLFGMMDAASHILVTSDSVSMISESCSSGKPVSIFHISGQSDKFDRFYSKIYEGGYAQRLDPQAPKFHYNTLEKPLDDAAVAAAAIKKLLDTA